MLLEKSIDSLPIEILLMIFKKLHFSDLNSAILVSKKWKNIIEDPFLWKKFTSKAVYPDQVGRLLEIPRLSMMKYLEMRTGGDKDMLVIQEVDEEEFKPKFAVHLARRVENKHVGHIQTSEISELDISSCDFNNANKNVIGKIH